MVRGSSGVGRGCQGVGRDDSVGGGAVRDGGVVRGNDAKTTGFEYPDKHATSTKDAEIAADFSGADLARKKRIPGGGGVGGDGGGGKGEGRGDGSENTDANESFGGANFEESLGYLP